MIRTKVVINKCFGGFHPSKKAILELMKLGCPHIQKTPLKFFAAFFKLSEQETRDLIENYMELPIIGDEVIAEKHDGQDRSCPILVAVVEKLGEEANSKYSQLKIVEIPDDVEWEIDEYDGVEIIVEKHRSWD